ncbi:MAG: hypothetical protein ACI8PZ_003284 [Myxococcota bacterium]|jgi:hypothetical protein
MFTSLIVALTLVGCQDFTSLEEACHDVVPGEGSINNADSVNGLGRVNCYRRLAGLGRGRVQKHAQAAVESHVKYVEANQPDFDRVEFEQSTVPGYTGYDVFDRLDAADYVFDNTAFDMGLWEFSFSYPAEVFTGMPDMIDYLAADPYTRQIFLQPSWLASGLATSTYEPEFGIDFMNLVVVYEYPATQRAENPVVYPKDGQVQVPTSHLVDDPTDPLCGQLVGYPITITVGSNLAPRGGLGASNPYGLEVLNAGLHGPDGPIPVDVRAPGDTDRAGTGLVYTVAITPKEELSPGAEYTMDAAIKWIDGDKDVSATFRTASAAPDLGDPADVFCIEDFVTTTTDPTPGGGTGGGTGSSTSTTTTTGTGTGSGTGGGTEPGLFRINTGLTRVPGARVD